VVIVAGIGPFVLWHSSRSSIPHPLNVHYVGSGDFSDGTMWSGPTFCVTNCSWKTLSVSIWTLQVYTGSNWIAQPYIAPSSVITLPPFTSGYLRVDFSIMGQPTNKWRLELSSAERLNHLESAVVALRYAPAGWRQVNGRGIPLRKLLQQMKGTWYGRARKVLTDEVEAKKGSA
jgi:hypothetical protein